MLGEKIGKYLGEVTLYTIFINTFNSIRKVLTSDEYKDIRTTLVSHAGNLFGIGLADEAGFMVRAAKALTPAEFKMLTHFLSTRSPKEKVKFRCSVTAIDFIEQKHTVTTGTGAKKVMDEFTTLKDPARNLLKMIASSKLTDSDREEICKGLGLFDFPFDPKDVAAWIDNQLADAAKKVRKTRRSFEKKYGSLKTAAPVGVGPIGKFFDWLNRVFPV